MCASRFRLPADCIDAAGSPALKQTIVMSGATCDCTTLLLKRLHFPVTVPPPHFLASDALSTKGASSQSCVLASNVAVF